MTGKGRAKAKQSELPRSAVVSLRFQRQQLERLRRLARRLGRTPGETTAMLVEEALRRAEFGCIDFRDSPVGRQAYVQASGLAVWEVIGLARLYHMDVNKCAEHLKWPAYRIQAALNYSQAFPAEIEEALEENASYDFQTLSRMLPHAEEFTVKEESRRGYGSHKRTKGAESSKRLQGEKRKRI